MYKISNFIEIIENDKLVIINTLTGKLFTLSNKSIIKRLLNSNKNQLSEIDHNILNRLINEKIIIEDDDSETYISELKYYDTIYDTTCYLTILPTEQCNFRCSYCYEKYNNGKMTGETVDSIIKYLKKNGRKFSGINVSWFGGEPLIAADVIEDFSVKALEISKFYNIPYMASITTNGYLLDYTTFERLLELKVLSYQITIDGTEEYHDKSRYTINYGKSYRRIIDNLIDIKNKAKNKHFTISVRCNLTKESIENIDNFIDEMEYYFGGDKRFEFYFRPVGNWITDKIDNEKILKSDGVILDKLLSNPKKLNYSSYYSFLFSQQCNTTKRNSYVIRSNGAISKCTVYLDESVIGKINNNGEMLINLNKLGRWILPEEKVQESCRKCAFWSKCHGFSCPVKKISNRNSKSTTDCGFEINSIEKIIKLIEQSDSYNQMCNIISLDS